MYLGIFHDILELKKHRSKKDSVRRHPACEVSIIATGLQYRDIYGIWDKKGTTMSVNNLPDKSWNLSSYIMECGSSEKIKVLLEKFQLILRRTFFRNISCNIFMK